MKNSWWQFVKNGIVFTEWLLYSSLKYFASQRIEVNRKSQVKDGDEVIGTEVKLKVVKNKVSAPYGEGVTVLTFAEGINRAAETALIAEEIGIITKTGRTYRYTPSNKFGVDKDGNRNILEAFGN